MPDFREMSFPIVLKRVVVAFLCVFSLSTFTSAQNDESMVTRAFDDGDAAALSAYLQPEVWVCIKDFEDSLNASEAAVRLERFFKDHPVRSFERLHNGGSANKVNEVVIGKLSTEDGDYRVYVYFSGEAAKKIDELRIEH
ncbi:MAG TPA: DUF4783 domain-containing protein [Saprospiraceae bacterium]|nr:DUF4783 domain-containing protein [Saprospiraceae bacterium]